MRQLLHNLTHQHTIASKDFVGRITLCTPRWSHRMSVNVSNYHGEWNFQDLSADQLRALICCDTADQLRATAERMESA